MSWSTMFLKPKLDIEDIQRLVLKVYGLKVLSVENLDSYDDKNYHIGVVETVDGNCKITRTDRHGYTLKILNTVSSQKTAAIDIQHTMIEEVSRIGIKTPKPQPNLKGDNWSMELLKSEDGNNWFLVRLFNYVPGTLLQSVPVTLDLCYQIGECAGKMDVALKNVSRPIGWECEFSHWSMEVIPELLQHLHPIKDGDDRHLLQTVIQEFDSKVLSCYEKFQKGFIHGDMNDANILVTSNTVHNNNKNSTSEEDYKLEAIIDFGDFSFSLYIFEAAIMMSYLVLLTKDFDIVNVPGKILSGYLKYITLSDAELCFLKLCMCARLAQSIVRGALSNENDVGNTYTQNTSITAWKALKKLWPVSNEGILKQWLMV
ncbi:hydroxylysine kinase [Patella vulgata]|uniref:hydroxylysine kinase n=1 Tax=Patella vulgata TaxID=6465 RepID=UPI002180142D|nr:hydroxylysine kinase [Patella vulgata]